MIRRYLVWQHRWVGLAMTLFVVTLGVTGALLAYREPLTCWLNPELFAGHAPSEQSLDLATLAERAEAIEPRARVWYFGLGGNRQASLRCVPRTDPATGRPFELDFDHLLLDPVTGLEIARVKDYGPKPLNRRTFMAYVYDLHTSLLCGSAGWTFVGYVAVAWVVDCFVGFYLTLPVGWTPFWRRWGSAWRVRWRAVRFRQLFDLHRAAGLWFWPLLFVFTWSGVMFNCSPVYERVTAALFDYRRDMDGLPVPDGKPVERPRLGWRDALQHAERDLADQARARGFTVIRPAGLAYIAEVNAYSYTVQSSLDFRHASPGTVVMISADTGAHLALMLPRGEHTGNTLSNVLWGLHYADLYGSGLYRCLVFLTGLVVALLAITGAYLWWRKRRPAASSKC